MAQELTESKYAKKLQFRKSNIGIFRFKGSKDTEFENLETGVPLPLAYGFVGPKSGPGRYHVMPNNPLLPHEKLSQIRKFH